MAHPRSLERSLVLVVQRSWLIASALANSFESKGAKVVLAKESATASAKLPHLTAAVLDGQSRELGWLLEMRGIPFVLYTARALSEGTFARAPTVEKPAPVADVVARVEELLACGGQSNS